VGHLFLGFAGESGREDAAGACPRRRRLLAATACAASLAASTAFGRNTSRAAPRQLWVTRPEAQETVRTTYWADGALQPDGYRALEHIFRDIHAGVRHPISVALLHLNAAMQSAINGFLPARPIVLFSGYRTARTSELVGGARPDIHREGLADDFIIPGLSFEDNLRLARLFQVGGLGAYPARGSLHKDVGRLRSWVGTPDGKVAS
jgi:uncharacterized protein YcbK (DUF882 family)